MRTVAGLAAPFGQQSAHPGRSFELAADGALDGVSDALADRLDRLAKRSGT